MSCDCHNFKERLLSLQVVQQMIKIAYKEKKPLSLSRFSHAELLYLSWPEGTTLTTYFDKYRKYNGGTDQIDEIKEGVLEALNKVDITGILTTGDWDSTNWDKMTNDVFHKLDFTPEHVCSAWITQQMVRDPKKKFMKWLKNKDIILVGRRSKEAAKKLKKLEINVVDCVGMESYAEIEEVQQKLVKNKKWKIALLSAGIQATILAPRLAAETGKIAIDFGHAMDIFLDGTDFDHEDLVDKWNTMNNLEQT
ncbi:hypothetical protein CVD28_19345 [Bacillus sp. M6-12]|uniref:GT-D fold domain-containing protein n=1 Tax=Bacillus sp. M6-12 TaxID=2054166 RepID=UPI000C777889|nr:GT-D fold domain-containing glycosyltransferase [Bacillus sp. M6-12]PLS16194.1 hypothetical protein CVD28_19345 [Bacillus sp. M6-12]